MIAAAVVLACGAVSAEDLAENQARFAAVDGTVQVLSQGSANWVDAHIDLPLEVGDQISVGDDGQAELSLAKHVLVILDSSTEVIIGHTTTQEGHLTLTEGALVGKVEPLNGTYGAWSIETPLGVCTITGTEFAVTHSEDKGMHVGVFKGAVQVSQAETAEGTLPASEISAHQEAALEKRKPLRTMKAFSPEIRKQALRLSTLQQRFRQIAAVWVPMTTDYRLLLRRKYIAEVKPHPKPIRTAPPARRS